jgi:hypothetical protein
LVLPDIAVSSRCEGGLGGGRERDKVGPSGQTKVALSKLGTAVGLRKCVRDVCGVW